MRNSVLLASTATAALLLASSALADVTVRAEITKDKDVTVTETVSVSKVVTINVIVRRNLDKTAEADSVINQANHRNRGCGSCAEKFDFINSSVNFNIGAVSVNQAAGSMNNQANVVTAAIDRPVPGDGDGEPGDGDGDGDGDPGTGAFANAQSMVDQRNGVIKEFDDFPNITRTQAGNLIDSIDLEFREARMNDSVNSNFGIVHVNQATGLINNQANVLTLAAGLDSGIALAEADLGQENSNNIVHEIDVEKKASMYYSVNGNHGVVGVNQTAGNLGNQANVVAVGAAVFTASF